MCCLAEGKAFFVFWANAHTHKPLSDIPCECKLIQHYVRSEKLCGVTDILGMAMGMDMVAASAAAVSVTASP